MTIPLLLETDDILAVDKPEGIATIPERDSGRDCVARILETTRGEKLFVVHRLDKEVSGVLLFARNAQTHAWLNEQFSSRRVRKTYLALVEGSISGGEVSVDRALRLFGSGRMGVDAHHGKPALTSFRVLERFSGATLIHAFPVTGRRHQIRVHSYAIGHPILGDLRYGRAETQRRFPRLMLHAQSIAFRTAALNEVTVEAPVPPEFLRVMTSLRVSDHWRPGEAGNSGALQVPMPTLSTHLPGDR
jgi:RluA family pseudouridine synthase